MIAVNINAGLANQMFHYAFGRGLTAKGYNVVFDQTNFKSRSNMNCETTKLQDVFPAIELQQMPEGHFKWVVPRDSKIGRRIRNLMIVLHNLIGKEKYILEPCYAYCPNIESRISSNCIFRGFWQSEKYFAHCKEDIRKQFTFLPFDEAKNIEIVDKMAHENSVAIHLRKGKDYLADEMLSKGLCTVEYYIAAIEYIRDHVEKPVFYLFTDNPAWVKENLPAFDYTLVDWNEVSGKRNFRDMQLMSCCKHNIIANSTYSWWGAWLNTNPNKIVIGPKKFFNGKYFSKADIICDDWIKL